MSPVPLPAGRPVICLITDRNLGGPRPLEELVLNAVAGGVNMVQLREKDLPTRELLKLAKRLKETLAGQAPLLVNGRPDVAFAAEADGAHLPADGLPPKAARAALGRGALIGRSIHSPREARAHERAPLDYLELGTIFPSRSHPGGRTLGPEGVRAACAYGVPILAIGGVTHENVGDVIEAGASGVAVISAILADPDPKGAAQRLANAALNAWQNRGAGKSLP